MRAKRGLGIRVAVPPLVAVLALGLALAGATARAGEKQVSGDFTSVLVPPPACASPIGICTRGTLTGDIRGTYDFVMETWQPAGDPAAPTTFVYTGHSVITFARGGARLFGQDTGVMDVADPSAARFVTTVTIVGGTKQYEGASGRIVASGTLSFATGEAAGTYEGTIRKASTSRKAEEEDDD